MSLDSRRDIRPVKTFAANVADFTNRERLWAEAFRLHLLDAGSDTVVIEDHGVDNTGGLIEADAAFYQVDKNFVIDGQSKLVEIKTVPETNLNYITFKVNSLRACVEQDASILVPRKTHLWFFTPTGVSFMLAHNRPAIYAAFSPNDPAIRLWMNVLPQYVELGLAYTVAWSAAAQQFVDQHTDVLFAVERKSNE
jgi:hypothetical protein